MLPGLPTPADLHDLYPWTLAADAAPGHHILDGVLERDYRSGTTGAAPQGCDATMQVGVATSVLRALV